MFANSPVGSSKSASTTPAGNAANASSVGANTVNGPAPERSSANSAAITAASNVVCTGLSTMMSTTVAG